MDTHSGFLPYLGQLFAGSLLTGVNFASSGILGGGAALSAAADSSGDYKQDQPYASGNHHTMNAVFLLMILPMLPGIIRTSIEWLYQKILSLLNDRYNVSILIKEDEDIFYSVNQYVTKKQEETQLRAMRHVEGVQKRIEVEYNRYCYDNPDPCPELTLVPLPGVVEIRHKDHTIWVTRRGGSGDVSKLDSSTTLDDLTNILAKSTDVLKLSMRGTDVRVLKNIIQEWVNQIYYEDIKKLTVYRCMRHHGDYTWSRTSNREMRTYDSVVLKKGQQEEILQDTQRFLDARKKYDMRGIPYRHAVILHGPPGTGKTSCIKGLAQRLKKNIAHISLEVSMDDETFIAMLSAAPMNSIVVIEDFDRSHLANKRAGSDSTPKGDVPLVSSRITEGGLLNALDGIDTPDGTLFFLTCNDINKIGDAVKRPGRIDQVYLVSYADEYQIEEMFWRFFGEGDAATDPNARDSFKELQKTAHHFVRHIQKLSGEMTTAILQKFFLEFEKDNETTDGKVATALLRDFDFVKNLYDKIIVETFDEMMTRKEAADEAKRNSELETP